MRGERREYFWLVAKDPETGKQFLVYGGTNESEARKEGLETLGGVEFRIIPLRTVNLQTASSMWRGRRLKKTHSLKRASERLGHDKSIKRMKRRRNKGHSHKDQGYEIGD